MLHLDCHLLVIGRIVGLNCRLVAWHIDKNSSRIENDNKNKNKISEIDEKKKIKMKIKKILYADTVSAIYVINGMFHI